jgi:uncharacterized protein
MNDGKSTAVKVVYEWRVAAAGSDAFARWLEALTAAAAAARGYEGASVFGAGDDRLLLLRFGDRATLEAWQQAPATVAQFAAAAAFASGGRQPQHRTGLETWFTLPGASPHAAPPRWKMALVTWCALLPQVLLIGELMPTWMPKLARAAIGTAIPVAMLTWVVMPWLSRGLQRWLFRPPARVSP